MRWRPLITQSCSRSSSLARADLLTLSLRRCRPISLPAQLLPVHFEFGAPSGSGQNHHDDFCLEIWFEGLEALKSVYRAVSCGVFDQLRHCSLCVLVLQVSA